MTIPFRGLLLVILVTACAGGPGVQGPLDPPSVPPPAPPPPPPPTPPATYDLDLLGVPKFAAHDYLDPTTVEAITRFRSSFGHDYHDDLESCRSMKHYFRPRAGTDWAAIPIYSPVAGSIERTRSEVLGTQILIRSAIQPAFRFILFHVTTGSGIDSGAVVAEGQVLGHHVSNQTMTDIAVSVDTPAGYRLVSWFEVMTDQLFSSYSARGVASRGTMVISKATRDADPLMCDGETFTTAGTLESWVALP